MDWAGSVREVQARYRWIAAVYPAFDVLLGVPPGSRALAVERLGAPPGSRVLEVGCGTGRNLARLRASVGPTGSIWGVDVTPEMLARARARCRRWGWSNVTLVEADAATWSSAETFDALLFCFSFSVLPNPGATLRNLWPRLRPGGRAVVFDAARPTGSAARFVTAWGGILSKLTVSGNPARRPDEALREHAISVSVEVLRGGWYAIYTAVKEGEPAPAR